MRCTLYRGLCLWAAGVCRTATRMDAESVREGVRFLLFLSKLWWPFWACFENMFEKSCCRIRRSGSQNHTLLYNLYDFRVTSERVAVGAPAHPTLSALSAALGRGGSDPAIGTCGHGVSRGKAKGGNRRCMCNPVTLNTAVLPNTNGAGARPGRGRPVTRSLARGPHWPR